MSDPECLFTGGACDGGTVYANGVIGCAFKESPEAECAWTGDMPPGTSPRDFYNEKVMEAMR